MLIDYDILVRKPKEILNHVYEFIDEFLSETSLINISLGQNGLLVAAILRTANSVYNFSASVPISLVCVCEDN